MNEGIARATPNGDYKQLQRLLRVPDDRGRPGLRCP